MKRKKKKKFLKRRKGNNMVGCPVCEEEMSEEDNEFCDDTFIESTSVTVTIECPNEKCPMGSMEIDYCYGSMINMDEEEIEKYKDEYKQRKVLEGI